MLCIISILHQNQNLCISIANFKIINVILKQNQMVFHGTLYKMVLYGTVGLYKYMIIEKTDVLCSLNVQQLICYSHRYKAQCLSYYLYRKALYNFLCWYSKVTLYNSTINISGLYMWSFWTFLDVLFPDSVCLSSHAHALNLCTLAAAFY